MKALQKTVVLASIGLFAVWLTPFFRHYSPQDSELVIRFVLGSLFALLIIFRRKKRGPGEADPSRVLLAGLAAAGTVLAVVGIVMAVHQLEWLGILLLLYTALRWALPTFFGRDIVLALFVLYWVHPLPGFIISRIEAGLQMLSVQGAEWVLQWINQRVWADGSALFTGLRVFEVDRTCSGLRTATTVLLCVLGAGLLHRMKAWEIVLFGVAGTLQVATLNILRVVFMVWWAPRMPVAWSDTFLHDTLGILVLSGIVLVQLEMSVWKTVRKRRQDVAMAIELGQAESPDLGSFLPRFWVILFRWVRALLAVGVTGAIVTAAVYQSRPAHRAAMIAGVVDGLIRSNLAEADRATEAALKLTPGDRGLITKRLHILVRHQRYAAVLRELEGVRGELTQFEQVLKGWALMGVGRVDDAMAVIERLPEAIRESPNVAVFQAEFAIRKDQPAAAGRNAVLAARSHTSIERVRSMFSYLASREQWQSIADCDSPVPFKEFPHALIAIEANFKMNRLASAGETLKRALAQWPGEPRLLGSLYDMTIRGGGDPWERLMEDHLKVSLPALDADRLATYIGYSFRLVRPDLAWMLFRRLGEVDPKDPALALAAVQYGPVWFTFRKHALGMKAEDKRETIDMRAEFRKKINTPEYKSRWGGVPLAEDMLGSRMDRVRDKYLDECLAELERREKDGKMSRRLDMTFPVVLGFAGKYSDAHRRLSDLEKKYPRDQDEIVLQRAVLYDRCGQWQECYELLREPDRVNPGLVARMLLVNALMNMNQGLCAMDLAQRARHDFPDAVMPYLAQAAVWDVFGFKEEALFALTQGRAEHDSHAYVQLLYDTGRYGEARKASQAFGIRYQEDPDKAREGLIVPAELTMKRQWPKPLTADVMAKEWPEMEKQAAQAASPFIRQLRRVEAEWLKAGGSDEASSMDRWLAAGRDNRERAAALHRLAVLLGCLGRYEAASSAVQRALDFLPNSVVLWRMWVALSEGDRNVIDKASEACPDDPDIWLAKWVKRVRMTPAPGEDGAVAELTEIETSPARRFSAGTMVRAADFLIRNGRNKAAVAAARRAVEQGNGLLPAYVVAMRCAIATRDLKWARTCALGGVDSSLDPQPFHEMIVNLSFAQNTMDSDLMAALEFLKRKFPEDREWTERLGFVHFQKGDTSRALSVLGPLIRGEAKGLRVDSLIVAAEAARVEGKASQAVSILETANAMYPKTLSILNNLVYTLSLNPATLGRARTLLPELLSLGGDSFAVKDTVAMVYFRGGQMEEAESFMREALKGMDSKDYAALDVQLNTAEILMARGRKDEARSTIEVILKNPKCPKPAEGRGRELLKKLAQSKLDQELAEALRLYQVRKFDESLAIVKRVLLDPNCPADLEKAAGALLQKVADAKAGK